jgi:hypothetical protein
MSRGLSRHRRPQKAAQSLHFSGSVIQLLQDCFSTAGCVILGSKMVPRHHGRSPCYANRVEYVRRLLRTAIHSGEKGMLEGDVANVRKCTSSMTRAYENALKRSLDICLTKRHCGSIDEKSHEIELLRPRLEKRIAELKRCEISATTGSESNADYDFGHLVPVFIDRSIRFIENAKTMREINSEVMGRSDFHGSAGAQSRRGSLHPLYVWGQRPNSRRTRSS